MSRNSWRQSARQRSQRHEEDVLGYDRNVRRCAVAERDRGRSYDLRTESNRKKSHWQEIGDFTRSDYPRSHDEKANIKVIVTSLAGDYLLGPEVMPCSSLVASLKERLRKTRPGNGVKILHDTQQLMDHDTLGTRLLAPVDTMHLTAVLSKTYRVVVWGESAYGGTAVPGSLEDGVLELYNTSGAFAVIKEGGAVVAWGHPAYGGELGQASRQLTCDVTTICAGQNSFVALTTNGAAVAWGNASLGGRPSGTVAKRLTSGVISVKSSGEAFAALKSGGEVVTWGQAVSGGDSSAVSHQLAGGVVKLHSTRGAFAALKQDGSVVTWGNPHNGGNSIGVSNELANGIVQVISNTTSFAALKEGGMVVAWGNESCGGSLGVFAEKLRSGVVAIYSSWSAFAAKKADGSVVSWGKPGHPAVAAEILAHGGIAVKTNGKSVAMILESGQVVTDGEATSGGDSSKVASQLERGVVSLASTSGAFAAQKEDGSVVTWGRGKPVNLGGDSSSVASDLERGVLAICSTQSAFAALREVGQ